MSFGFINGLPGVGTGLTASPKTILRSLDRLSFAAGGVVLNGTKSADTSNSDHPYVLTNGLALGKVTSGGLYANSIIGVTGVLHDAGATATVMTLPAAVVTEIQRRIGTSGTFKIVGPPTAAGTVASETVTFSAIASSTTLTITDTGTNYAAGSLIMPLDGSETIKGLLFNEWGVRMTNFANDRVDQPLPCLMISGDLLSASLPHYSSMDESVQTWFMDQLNASGRTFTSDDY